MKKTGDDLKNEKEVVNMYTIINIIFFIFL